MMNDGCILRKRSEVFLAAEVGQVVVVDGEIRGEHRRCDFVAVCTVAHECADETGGFGGLIVEWEGGLVSYDCSLLRKFFLLP